MLDDLFQGRHLSLAFQPIVHLLTGELFAYEVLGRGPETSEGLELGPATLIEQACEAGCLLDLEHAWRTLAIEYVARNHAHDEVDFFLNVDPRILEDPNFTPGFTRSLLDRHHLSPQRFVLELTEPGAFLHNDRLAALVQHYASQGFRIALDDLGAGYASLNALLGVRPHLVKLDMNVVRGLDSDPIRLNLVRSLSEFSRRSGMPMIAEGIETRGELSALVRAGVVLGQGYLLARPARGTHPPTDDVRTMVRGIAQEVSRTRFESSRTVRIDTIVSEADAIRARATCREAERRMRDDATCTGLVVVDELGRALGLLMRDKLLSNLTGRFGYALHELHPVTELMDRHPLRVPVDAPIDAVSRLATSRPTSSSYDLVIVEDHGQCAGVVTVQGLLAATTELEIQHARYASPLTGLPGNVVIEHVIGEALERTEEPTFLLYADLDGFKAYNDVYGFPAGDEVIRLVARLLDEELSKLCLEQMFVGHVGGDDFVAVLAGGLSAEVLEDTAGYIARAFDERIRLHYAPEDLARGGLFTTDRRGTVNMFPVVGLSMAIFSLDDLDRRDLQEVGRVAAELKHLAKSEARHRGGRSGWVRERRRPGRPADDGIDAEGDVLVTRVAIP